MIIACPACTTRYVVPDSAIGVDGRTVRCAKCRHSWFQDGAPPPEPAPQRAEPPAPQAVQPAPSAETAPPPAPAPQPEPIADDPPAEDAEPVDQRATMFDPRPPASPQPDLPDHVAEPDPQPSPPAAPDLPNRRTEFDPRPAEPGEVAGVGIEPIAQPPEAAGPVSEEPGEVVAPPAYASPAPPEEPEPDPPVFAAPRPEPNAVDVVFEQSPSSFAYEPPFRPRRNPAKLWTAAAVAFALFVASVIGAVSYWGMPDWLPVARPIFGPAPPDLKLEFPPERQDRRTLPNGTEFFGASGTVTNVGQDTRRVPAILIVLRDGRERIVYTWEVRASKTELAPGESVTINEAVTDVPRSAKFAEIGWKR